MNLQKTITVLLVTSTINFVVIESGCCGKNNHQKKTQTVVEKIKDAFSTIIHGDKKSKEIVKKRDENCVCDADCVCFDQSGNKCSCSQAQVSASLSTQSENNQESDSTDASTDHKQKKDAKLVGDIVTVIEDVEQTAVQVVQQTTETVASVVDNVVGIAPIIVDGVVSDVTTVVHEVPTIISEITA